MYLHFNTNFDAICYILIILRHGVPPTIHYKWCYNPTPYIKQQKLGAMMIVERLIPSSLTYRMNLNKIDVVNTFFTCKAMVVPYMSSVSNKLMVTWPCSQMWSIKWIMKTQVVYSYFWDPQIKNYYESVAIFKNLKDEFLFGIFN
jgi:hypothetical protein